MFCGNFEGSQARERCIFAAMSAGLVVRGVLFGALLLACGERPGDPVVRLASQSAGAGADAGGAAGTVGAAGEAAAGGNAASVVPDAHGPVGLCGACTSNADCGDTNDACLSHFDQHFCGRDCDEQHACPDGYSCVSIDNAPFPQCVPVDHCPTQPVPAPPLADIRDYVLARINSERATYNRAPLSAVSCLDQLAQDSAIDFARTDEPLGKYRKECDPVWPNCACGWNTEAELSMAHYNFDWMLAVDHYLAVTPYNQNDRFVQGFLDANVTDVGIGCWVSGDQAWLALSFR